MYQVYSLKLKKIIAYHLEKRVVRKYKEHYEKNTDDTLKISKIDHNDLPVDYYDLYLIKYGENYIQDKYYEIYQVDVEVIVDDYFYAHDVILRACKTVKNNKKKVKRLLKADSIILEEVEKISSEFYDCKKLEERKKELDMWKNKIWDKYI